MVPEDSCRGTVLKQANFKRYVIGGGTFMVNPRSLAVYELADPSSDTYKAVRGQKRREGVLEFCFGEVAII